MARVRDGGRGMKLLLAAFLGGLVLLLVAIARRGAPGAETPGAWRDLERVDSV